MLSFLIQKLSNFMLSNISKYSVKYLIAKLIAQKWIFFVQ